MNLKHNTKVNFIPQEMQNELTPKGNK